MKIRQGFISNSSSSSFVVTFHAINTQNEIKSKDFLKQIRLAMFDCVIDDNYPREDIEKYFDMIEDTLSMSKLIEILKDKYDDDKNRQTIAFFKEYLEMYIDIKDLTLQAGNCIYLLDEGSSWDDENDEKTYCIGFINKERFPGAIVLTELYTFEYAYTER